MGFDFWNSPFPIVYIVHSQICVLKNQIILELEDILFYFNVFKKAEKC